MNIQRRKFIAGTAVIAAGVSVFSVLTPAIQAQAAPILEELMKPGPLGDISEGSEDAPVTIIEYASLTCPHCASFHNNIYPQLKEKYIDTGKVRLVMREFPLDRVALAASMVARCADKSQYFPIIGILFKQQSSWAQSKDPASELFKIAKLAGFTEDKFNKCINDKEIAQGIIDVKTTATEKFEVRSTPTFFINGEKVNGPSNFDDFEKLILPLIEG